jgi:copper chaperone CopZ
MRDGPAKGRSDKFRISARTPVLAFNDKKERSASMQAKRTDLTKHIGPWFILVLAAAVIFVPGCDTSSEKRSAQAPVTEYQKEIPPAEAEAAAAQEQARADGEAEKNYGIGENISKVALNVQRLSCSSCISNIKSALAAIDGIKEVFVNIASQSAQVYFDNGKLNDVARIAAAITQAGYPAKVIKTYSAEEIKKERDFAAARSKYYVASVGGWDIARTDFNTELEAAKRKYAKTYGEAVFSTPRGKALEDNLRAQIVSSLINEGIIMQEITKAGFKVDAGYVEDELQQFLKDNGKGLEEFKQSLQDSGYNFNYFRKKFETRMLINRYLNERVLADAAIQADRQQAFRSWFDNARVLAEIEYYDKALERVVQAQAARGTCGG